MEGKLVIDIWTLGIGFIAAMGIPSAITGVIIRRWERKADKVIAKAEEAHDNKVDAVKTNEKLLIKTTLATAALALATARAVQRIPDANCNGDMHAAIDYTVKVKNEYRDFFREQAIDDLFGGDDA